MDGGGFSRRGLIGGAAAVLAAPRLARAETNGQAPWRFLVVGDWGRGGRADQVRTAQAMKLVADREGSEFVVSTGDNVYRWGIWSKSDPRWDASFSRVYDESLGPWYAVLGNHDYGGSVDAQIWHGTRGGRFAMDSRWYARQIAAPGRPTLDLMFFDTVGWQGKEAFPFQLWGSTTDAAAQAAQAADMERALATAGPVKLAFGHHGIYSVAKYGGEKRLADLDDILRRHRVKAWVSGHDHCLYHVEHAGMHYVCSGAGSEVRGGYGGGPGNCVLAAPCDAVGQDASLQPVWRSYYRKAPGTAQNIRGGFALFEAGEASGRFRFYDSDAAPLGDWRTIW